MARGKGEVLLDIEGERFTLVFDMEAIAAFEDETDQSIFAVAAQMSGGAMPKLSLMGSLLKAALTRHHPQLTRTDAMTLFTRPGAQAALAEAFGLAMPAREDGQEEASGEGEAKGRRAA